MTQLSLLPVESRALTSSPLSAPPNTPATPPSVAGHHHYLHHGDTLIRVAVDETGAPINPEITRLLLEHELDLLDEWVA